jgi:hypothetical protein
MKAVEVREIFANVRAAFVASRRKLDFSSQKFLGEFGKRATSTG